jgi:hypothetical protein
MNKISHLLTVSLLLSLAFLIPVELFFHSPWNASHLQVPIILAVGIFLVLQAVSIYYLHKKLILFPIRYWSCLLWFLFFLTINFMLQYFLPQPAEHTGCYGEGFLLLGGVIFYTIYIFVLNHLVQLFRFGNK